MTLCNIGVYHTSSWFAYPLERMWCVGDVWRPDDNAHRLSPLAWQESGLRKPQILPVLLLEPLSWTWRVSGAHKEWSCIAFLKSFGIGSSFYLSTGFFMGCSIISWLDWESLLSDHQLFQVLLTEMSLWRGRSTYVSSKGGLLFSWTDEGTDTFFSFFL